LSDMRYVAKVGLNMPAKKTSRNCEAVIMIRPTVGAGANGIRKAICCGRSRI
jgi:hypothetical protein